MALAGPLDSFARDFLETPAQTNHYQGIRLEGRRRCRSCPRVGYVSQGSKSRLPSDKLARHGLSKIRRRNAAPNPDWKPLAWLGAQTILLGRASILWLAECAGAEYSPQYVTSAEWIFDVVEVDITGIFGMHDISGYPRARRLRFLLTLPAMVVFASQVLLGPMVFRGPNDHPPPFAFWPVGYHDATRLLLKIAVFQSLLVTPLVALYGALAALRFDKEIMVGIAYGFNGDTHSFVSTC